MDFVFVRKHASKYGLTGCLCAPLERGVNDSATRECCIPAACRRRDARERCEDFAADSCRRVYNLSITVFVGNIVFKYLSLVDNYEI